MAGNRQGYINRLNTMNTLGLGALGKYIETGEKHEWLDEFEKMGVILGIRKGVVPDGWPSMEELFSYNPNREKIKAYGQRALEVTEKVKKGKAPTEELKKISREIIKESENVTKFLDDFRSTQLYPKPKEKSKVSCF